MNIINQHSLSAYQIDSLKILVDECQQQDKTSPEMHWPLLTKSARYNSVFIIEKNKQIIGFLKLFFFYDTAAEIILLVHPENRNQKIATSLLNATKPLLQQEHISELRFSFKNNNCAWLKKKHAHYDYSDFLLSHDLNNLQPSQHKVELAAKPDIDDLLLLDTLCFKEPTLTTKRIEMLLKENNYDIWLIRHNNQTIAKLHINHKLTTSEIFDVAVHPTIQKQGYATSLLKYALLLAKEKQQKSVTLNVASNNEKALSLYINNGFNLKSSKYYWRMPTSSLDNTIK